MADNLKAAAAAAGLSEKELKVLESFGKAQSAHRQLSNLPSNVANKVFTTKYTPAQQADLIAKYGTEDPISKPNRGWLGTAWHYTGGAVAAGVGKALAGLQNVSDLSTRVARTGLIALDQGVPLVGAGNAWDIANDKGDKVFSPDRISKVRAKYGNAQVNVAMKLAAGEDIGKLIKGATPEELPYLRLAQKTQGTQRGATEEVISAEQANFNDALAEVNAAKYSPGRFVANLIDAITPGDLVKSGLAYRAVSGTVDAAYRIFADPLLLAGRAKRLIDVNRYALDVVIGKNGGVDDYFSKSNNVAFWDQYGKLLQDFTKAKETKNTAEQLAIRNQMAIMAPEFGPAVIKSFTNTADNAIPITDALSAKAFFKDTKQTDEMISGQIGRRRVLMPTLNAQRKARINFLTTADKFFDIDRVGPLFVEDTFFGAPATDDGIAKAIIDNQEKIVADLKANANPKNAAYFSTAMVAKRIDKFKQKFTPIPYAAMEGLDVMAKDADVQIFRLARTLMPQRESKLFAQAFDNADEGTRKVMYSGLWATVADFRGINLGKTGQNIERLATGKEKPSFALTVNGRNPSIPAGSDESIALVATDLSSWVSAPTLVDVDRLAAKNTLVQKIMGFSHSEFMEKTTSAWVFLTLAGPRYALRNATEDLMVNLAIGKNPWGIPVAKHLSTRSRTFLQPAKGLTKWEGRAEDPLGVIMRMVNKNESQKYAQKVQEIRERGGDVEEIRELYAQALGEGKMNRFYKAIGLGKMIERDTAILAKQIKFGDLNNALEDVVEGGKNLNVGLDYTQRSINYQRDTGTRVAALEVNIPKELKRAKVEKNYGRIDPFADDSAKTSWLLRIGYYANDELATSVLANLDNPEIAIASAREWLKNNPEVSKRFRWKDYETDEQGHAENIYEAVKQIMVKQDGETINTDLLNQFRSYDPVRKRYFISGKLTLDDLPSNRADVPDYINGPKLIAVSDSGNYTSSIMEFGYKWLGESNARMSREPIVLYNMIQFRKQLEDTGYERAFIDSFTRGIDPANTKAIEKATLQAERRLAEIVEDRARLQTLAYVDNPMVQSQMAFSIRNFARFYRASEDFARRITRVVKYNPDAIVKASLTYEGITHSGWIQEDDKGEPYFVYPGMTQVYRVVQGVMQALGVPAEFKVPFPVEFGAKVKMLTPSLNPDSLMPTFAGPLSGVSIKTISNLVGIFSPGSADTITRLTLGPYAEDQSMLSAFLPAHFNRIYAAMNQDERDGQYASAMRKSMTYLESAGHGLEQKYEMIDGVKTPIAFTPQELEEYRVRLKNTTLGILGLRVFFGFFAPASPQIQLRSDITEWARDNGKANFKQAWYSVLNEYPGDYDAAMKRWVELYPDQIPFTVSESDRTTVAYFRYAEESNAFVENNQDLFNEYRQGAAFLIPHKAGYSWDAYKTMTDMGLRKNKTVTDYLREVQTAADLQTYYDRKDTFEKSLTEVGTDFERSRLRQEWTDWSTTFKAGRPLVQEEINQGGKRAIERVAALNDLRNMLGDEKAFKAAPKTVSTLKQMLVIYDKFQESKKSLKKISGSSYLVDVEETDTLAKLQQLSKTNENTLSAYNVLFSKLMGA
jgi:hypothetical protein